MEITIAFLTVFPAFLIGAAFGIMIVMVLAGASGLKTSRPIVFSVCGSGLGIVVFLLTQSLWPPVVGPFVLCPAIAMLSALIGRRT